MLYYFLTGWKEGIKIGYAECGYCYAKTDVEGGVLQWTCRFCGTIHKWDGKKWVMINE